MQPSLYIMSGNIMTYVKSWPESASVCLQQLMICWGVLVLLVGESSTIAASSTSQEPWLGRKPRWSKSMCFLQHFLTCFFITRVPLLLWPMNSLFVSAAEKLCVFAGNPCIRPQLSGVPLHSEVDNNCNSWITRNMDWRLWCSGGNFTQDKRTVSWSGKFILTFIICLNFRRAFGCGVMGVPSTTQTGAMGSQVVTNTSTAFKWTMEVIKMNFHMMFILPGFW